MTPYAPVEVQTARLYTRKTRALHTRGPRVLPEGELPLYVQFDQARKAAK